MSASVEIVPSVLDRIRKTLVGLKMPRALEVPDQTVRQLERGEASALEAIDTLFAEELTLRENRRVKVALQMRTDREKEACASIIVVAASAGAWSCRRPRLARVVPQAIAARATAIPHADECFSQPISRRAHFDRLGRVSLPLHCVRPFDRRPALATGRSRNLRGVLLARMIGCRAAGFRLRLRRRPALAAGVTGNAGARTRPGRLGRAARGSTLRRLRLRRGRQRHYRECGRPDEAFQHGVPPLVFWFAATPSNARAIPAA
jgi:hypothetical protein